KGRESPSPPPADRRSSPFLRLDDGRPPGLAPLSGPGGRVLRLRRALRLHQSLARGSPEERLPSPRPAAGDALSRPGGGGGGGGVDGVAGGLLGAAVAARPWARSRTPGVPRETCGGRAAPRGDTRLRLRGVGDGAGGAGDRPGDAGGVPGGTGPASGGSRNLR